MRLLRALTPLVAVVLAAVLAPSAMAAFPGTNGLLVIAPAHGSGLQLIDAHGHGLRTICTDPNLCGSPAAPHFSPDGQAIAFGDTRSGRSVVVATDGTCLWCLLGPPLVKLKAATPAIKANGQTLSFSSGQNLYTVALTGGSAVKLATPTPGARGPISAAVWSPTGALAFVRGGSVWLIRPGHRPRGLGLGAQPTFSPDARRLAFVRQGWVWAVPVGGGKLARIVRGSGPAYSPDGRSLAFIANGGHVYVVGARGGRPRLVAGVSARALDWQPLTTTSSGRCAVPSGSSVVAQSSEALITYSPGTPVAPWTGCLEATGKRVSLVSLAGMAPGANAALGQVQLAGRFATFLLTTTDPAMNCANAVDEVDLSSGALTPLYTQTCTASSRGVDSLAVDSSGFTAWRTHEQIATAQPLTGAACATTTWCVAVDGHGNAATATAPLNTGGWSMAKVAPAFNDVRCPTATLCVGINGGQIATTTNPAGGAAGWSAPVTIDSAAQIGDIACTATPVCVAVDNAGNVITSTNPTGGASAWTLTALDPGKFLSGVSCPASNLCVAVGQSGDWFSTTTPAAGAPGWTVHSNAESTYGLLGVSCPTANLCVSSDDSGNLLTKSNPHLPGAWTPVHVPGQSSFIYRPVCPTTTLCVARDGTGDVIATTNLTAASPTFTVTNLAPSLSGLSCAHATNGDVCAASDANGIVHVTSTPTGGPSAWSSVGVDVPGCAPCIAEQLYARDDRAIQALDASQPGSGNTLADVSLGSNVTVLSWTHSGAAHRYSLK